MAMACIALLLACSVSAQRPRRQRTAFKTDTVMAHDPVMAYERLQTGEDGSGMGGKYYLLATGMGISWATSDDRKTWEVQPTPFLTDIPQWTYDSVPGFRGHIWAPDIIRKDGLWWLAYSCSTFGKNTSAIGLMTAEKLSGPWRDCGPLVCSREGRDNWNAIDPNFVIDDKGKLWLTWGSFWDGIQICEATPQNSFSAERAKTIARRVALRDTTKAEPNPTSQHAGRNAIEAPFIFKRGGWYYLFVSWDYCCRGAKSNYRVAVGRSKHVAGPYLDRNGKDMAEGGGTIFLEGDKQEYEAAGHCAVYHFPTTQTGQAGEDDGEDIFICHGYSTKQNGAALLIQRPVKWTPDGWPTL
jgi:arabinan endo-1,5-alpha-L-arabinosidase